MTHLRPRGRRLLAVPLGLTLAAALGLLPGAASAASAPEPGSSAEAAAGENLSYVVNTRTDGKTIARVTDAIADADGSVVATHKKIGVFVAHSANPDFAAELRGVRGVQSAGASRTAPLTPGGTLETSAPEVYKGAAKARSQDPDVEPLENEQWDLPAIGADKAHKISTGSRDVTVGVIDTGVDDTHPDLKNNFSAEQSANCVGGVADTTEGAWRPYDPAGDYHGTHVAGEIAAERNGVGVAGVAPGVQVASLKVSEPDTALFYAEAVVCAFVFAGDNGIEITNNSYYVDPWLYNCLDDPDQRAIVEAVNRASMYAMGKGTLHLAAAGNSNHDLASGEILDDSSPNDTTPGDRTIDPSECWDIPTQLPGIVTVSATGVNDDKSYYSSYGQKVVDVAAPGGDGYQIPDTPSKNGRILSTLPENKYGWLQGTSMATPHAAGVAALIKSKHPRVSPAALHMMMKVQADNPGCPEFYDPDGNGVEDSTCTGSKRNNGFYGAGIVDAYDAVRR
ncbi:S8 family serine peptidase [Streptomyces sp. MAR4 CNY-716]